jgi:hypothetical protein
VSIKKLRKWYKVSISKFMFFLCVKMKKMI